jgi:hypothetical protein
VQQHHFAHVTWTTFRTCLIRFDFKCYKRFWLPSLDTNWFSDKMVKDPILYILTLINQIRAEIIIAGFKPSYDLVCLTTFVILPYPTNMIEHWVFPELGLNSYWICKEALPMQTHFVLIFCRSWKALDMWDWVCKEALPIWSHLISWFCATNPDTYLMNQYK